MKINFAQVLQDLQGQPFKIADKPDDPAPKDMTLKDAAINVLCSPLPEDKDLTGKQAFERIELARRINAGGEVELSPEEAATIQNRAPKVYAVLIAGLIYGMLNG